MIALFATSEVTRVGKFGLIGILNTVLDFAVFNFLTSRSIGFGKVRANLISTSLAMVFSFFANRSFVFQAGAGNQLGQAVSFIIVTMIGLYVWQSLIIYALADGWRWPRRLVSMTIRHLHLGRYLETDFVVKNGAKAVATIVSLVWNYILYKQVVFHS